MKLQHKKRLVIIDRKGITTDKIDIFDADTNAQLFESSEPQLDRLSKVFRVIGGSYGRMSGVDYSIRDIETGAPILRVLKKGRMIGPATPFQLFDGAGNLLARFKKCFSIGGNKWRFTDDKKERIFDMTIKPKGFALSVKSITYIISINKELYATVSPHTEECGIKHDGKRARLLEFESDPEPNYKHRLLILGVSISLDRIIQHRHN